MSVKRLKAVQEDKLLDTPHIAVQDPEPASSLRESVHANRLRVLVAPGYGSFAYRFKGRKPPAMYFAATAPAGAMMMTDEDLDVAHDARTVPSLRVDCPLRRRYHQTL